MKKELEKEIDELLKERKLREEEFSEMLRVLEEDRRDKRMTNIKSFGFSLGICLLIYILTLMSL